MNPPCFLNLNYDNEMMNSTSHFESSQASMTGIHKLVGGLQSIISNNWNSPPKLKLSTNADLLQQQPPLFGDLMPLGNMDQLTVDPGFAERAARFSSFDGRNYSQIVDEFGHQNGKVSGVANIMSMNMSALQSEVSNGREDSLAVSDPDGGELCLAGTIGSNPRKRKAPTKTKGKDSNSTTDHTKIAAEEASSNRKKSRTENDAVKLKQDIENNEKPSDSPKDYIHVRARRGQATDSHSLAERVRREKISQRMKLLQDLVPGCNKVTGKAVMLDEIINYVQSLQRQVEFLSMKLATVNPQVDFNSLANLLAKDMHQTCGPIPSLIFPLETSGIASSSYTNQQREGTSLHDILNNGLETQSSLNMLDSTFHQNLNTNQSFVAGYEDAQSQLGPFWEDDFRRVVQMDMGQNPEIPVSSQSFNGSLPTSYMKIEL